MYSFTWKGLVLGFTSIVAMNFSKIDTARDMKKGKKAKEFFLRISELTGTKLLIWNRASRQNWEKLCAENFSKSSSFSMC